MGNVLLYIMGHALDDGDGRIREESVLASLEHAGGKIAHDRLGLDGEVAKHFVRAPSAEEFDCVGIDVGTKEGHCAGGSERAGADFFGRESDG